MSSAINKLICSFKSGLPNEVDFAMQAATVLANSDNFIWSDDYPLLDAICSSLHVYSCICQDDVSCYCYPRFWHKILDEKSLNTDYIQDATLPPDTEQSYFNLAMLKDHDLNDHNRIYKRVHAVAELIKQLSMTCGVDSTKRFSASPSLLKFISLLLFCKDMRLYLIGLDILANVASEIAESEILRIFQRHCIDNICCPEGDIYIIIRSMEVVSTTATMHHIDGKNLLARIEQLLTSRNDVNLFLAALECCYRISRHQPHLIATARAQPMIKILVNLLNCDEKQFFTPSALKRIVLIGDEESTEWTQLPPPRIISQKTVESKKIIQMNQPTTPTPTSTPIKEYTCEWNNCNQKFTEPKQVYTHIFETHIGSLAQDEQISCQWTGPNGSGPGCLTKRPKYSLLTHLNDFHCNATALERALTRSDPIKPPVHPGYGPNAALLAIKRHANNEKNGNKVQNSGSPLSVSVRLTAALILRNLATQSNEMKQALGNYEPLLSEICMTNGRDESKIIAECLSLFSNVIKSK